MIGVFQGSEIEKKSYFVSTQRILTSASPRARDTEAPFIDFTIKEIFHFAKYLWIF